MTLYKMITDHIIAYVNGAVSAGKESVLFWGVDENKKDVALKIYLVTTSSFKKREQYILGDPRFSKLKKGTKNLIYLWAKKEFRNLSQCYDCKIPVPKPIHVVNNVLAMEFVGENGAPAKQLLESEIDENDYAKAIEILKDLYKKVYESPEWLDTMNDKIGELIDRKSILVYQMESLPYSLIQ